MATEEDINIARQVTDRILAQVANDAKGCGVIPVTNQTQLCRDKLATVFAETVDIKFVKSLLPKSGCLCFCSKAEHDSVVESLIPEITKKIVDKLMVAEVQKRVDVFGKKDSAILKGCIGLGWNAYLAAQRPNANHAHSLLTPLISSSGGVQMAGDGSATIAPVAVPS